MRPDFYKRSDGLLWQPWPPTQVWRDEWLDLRAEPECEATQKNNTRCTYHPHVRMYDDGTRLTMRDGPWVAVLAFGDPKAGPDAWVRWDCVHGFTPVKETKHDDPRSDSESGPTHSGDCGADDGRAGDSRRAYQSTRRGV